MAWCNRTGGFPARNVPKPTGAGAIQAQHCRGSRSGPTSAWGTERGDATRLGAGDRLVEAQVEVPVHLLGLLVGVVPADRPLSAQGVRDGRGEGGHEGTELRRVEDHGMRLVPD